MREQAENYLKQALNNPNATFRDGQWESIEPLLSNNKLLVVQRTGWGKSMVYFLATKLLREQGRGPTLLISPLLSLMRNQIEAAARIGVVARTINSSNTVDWEVIENELLANQVDILLISPERLDNSDFMNNVLAHIAHNIGLFVVDEAHCISDWGHDFRPDYKKIIRVLQSLPTNISILATTATANNRVVTDIQAQLGQNTILQRGTLTRESLKLQNINMPSATARMAWLAQTIPTLPSSGIVYTLTQQDAENITEWLNQNNILSRAYHAGVENREELEQQLLNNQIKVLVATVALGMGFDKPDLGFVIHYQRPSSVVHYYQQVGRAGRAVDEAFGILLCGEEDDRIADYFIKSAFPPQQHIREILEALNNSSSGLSITEMQRVINLSKGQIEKTIKFLNTESPSPITKIDKKWSSTATANNYQIDQQYIDSITNIRRAEQAQMQSYMSHTNCLMNFLQRSLDDPSPSVCGKCKNCKPELLLNESFNQDLANNASIFLRRSYKAIEPRKQWPASNMFEVSELAGYKITENQRPQIGRSLSLWRDAGWGSLVAQGKYETNHFSDELVSACVEMLQVWNPNPAPQWVTCIPSLKRPNLVPDFAQRLADALDLPFIACIEKINDNPEQKSMENAFQKAKNLDGAFNINEDLLNTQPCLLVDDVIDSGWTFTVASALLINKGCSTVYPMALALNSIRID